MLCLRAVSAVTACCCCELEPWGTTARKSWIEGMLNSVVLDIYKYLCLFINVERIGGSLPNGKYCFFLYITDILELDMDKRFLLWNINNIITFALANSSSTQETPWCCNFWCYNNWSGKALYSLGVEIFVLFGERSVN